MLTDAQVVSKKAQAYSVFTPSTPINVKDLFFGRLPQLMDVMRAVMRPGQHAVMFGERGVGKTSLGNVVKDNLPLGEDVCVVKVNCSVDQSYSDIWKAIFREVEMHAVYKKYPPLREGLLTAIEHLVDKENSTTITPDDARFILAQLPTSSIIVIDELDRIRDPRTKAQVADTVKALSDHGVSSTLILIGVGNSIADLVAEHASITRALAQISIPRMSKDELRQIVTKGLERLGMEVGKDGVEHIVQLSLGLPHYTHLLSLEATMAALDNRRLKITKEDLDAAIRGALKEKQESTAQDYYNATDAPRGVHYPTILLACALVKPDERGNFAPVDVGRVLNRLTDREWTVASFTKHLREFATDKRGAVLIEHGAKRRFKYKFKDPLLQPYVILRGVSEEKIPADLLSEINYR